jgi:beta-N-acetylhexosaminidase
LVLLCNQSTPESPEGGRAVDDLLDGLAQAQRQGQWAARAASEARRSALLPTSPALDWDSLMQTPAYLQALALLP